MVKDLFLEVEVYLGLPWKQRHCEGCLYRQGVWRAVYCDNETGGGFRTSGQLSVLVKEDAHI
jgi:hypothetical protein